MDIPLHTTIKATLLRHYLMRGTVFAILGALFLLITGSILPVTVLSTWGFFIYLSAISLITYGLLPYSRLKRLELNPYKLNCKRDSIDLWRKQKLLMSLPKENILEVSYLEEKKTYGILFILKKPASKRMILLNRLGFFSHCKITKEGNLFLLYFNKRVLCGCKKLHQNKEK